MSKLPVFKTVGQVFGFVVERRFFTLLRLVWFPSVLAVIIETLPALYVYSKFGILPSKVDHQIVGVKLNLDNVADPVLLGLDLLNFVASILLGAIVAVSIHRLILLDDRKPGTFFYLRLHRQEWIYILGWIIYFIAICLAFAPILGHIFYATQDHWKVLFAGGPGAANEILKPLFNEPSTLIALGLSIVLMFVVLVRFGLVFPIVVAEDRLSFGRSWRLTRGNFWRLIVFWILVAVLGLILLLLLMAIVAVAVAAIVGSVAFGGQAVGALGVLLFVVPAATAFLVYFVVAVTIFVAALSFTYRALAGSEHGEGAG